MAQHLKYCLHHQHHPPRPSSPSKKPFKSINCLYSFLFQLFSLKYTLSITSLRSTRHIHSEMCRMCFDSILVEMMSVVIVQLQLCEKFCSWMVVALDRSSIFQWNCFFGWGNDKTKTNRKRKRGERKKHSRENWMLILFRQMKRRPNVESKNSKVNLKQQTNGSKWDEKNHWIR